MSIDEDLPVLSIRRRIQFLALIIALLAAIACSTVGEATAQEKPKIEVVPQIGHTGYVNSVAFSSDGRQVLSGSWDNTLKLWDSASGALLRTFQGHAGWVNAVALSPDGRLVLSGGDDKTLKLWDAASGTLLRTFLGHSSSVLSVAFSPDGRRMLSGSQDKTLKLWDAAGSAPLRTFDGHSGTVSSVAFSPDGRQLLSGSWDKTLKLWDAAGGTLLRTFAGHSGAVNSVAFSPNGRQVLSGGVNATLKPWDIASGTLKLWDVASDAPLRTLEGHSAWVGSVAFSPDGQLLLSGSAGKTLKLWDAAGGTLLRTFEGHSSPVVSVAFSPNGRQVLSGSRDKTLKLWDAAGGTLLRTFEGRADEVTSVAFSPDGRRVLLGSQDTTLKLWDAAGGTLLRTFEGHSELVTSVAFSPDRRQVLSGSADKTLKLWDADSGTLSRTFEGHSGGVIAVAFSPEGRRVVSGGRDSTLRLWDAASGILSRTFEGQSEWIWSVAFSPDGRLVLSGGDSGIPKLRDAANGDLLRTFRKHLGGVRSVAFSPDGRRIVSGGEEDNTLRLWDAATAAPLRALKGHSGLVASETFSPDGRQVLSGSRDKTLKLWNVAGGALLRTFTGHSGEVNSVAFSPDGRQALSGAADGTMRIWNAGTGQLLVSSLATPRDEWLTITPEGFFAGSGTTSDQMLSLVRGLDVTTIGQVHQSLFNPELVRATLAGDPDGEVAAAAKVINLDKVLDSGPAPLVTITSPAPGGQFNADLVDIAAHVEDRGKGIGRIQWRVNGITAGITHVAPGRSHDVVQTVALDPGDNQIEVVAYEGRNILASLPARIRITHSGPVDSAKPTLYVLAIGINKYEDRGGPFGRFGPLTSSVPDAKAFAVELEKAAAGQYAQARVTFALDENATAEKLDEAIGKIADEISPRDTFVLYAAAHGYSLQGRYYMIPQDYQGGGSPDALKAHAIDQDRIQEWLASRIKAKRAVVLLDTCESGALTGGYTKSRIEGTVSEASVGRLHEATGRPVITAASPGKSAYENYRGHGVFTYALIEALRSGDANNNGTIEISELAAHLARRVPELFAELKQSGWVVKGLTAHGGGDERQSAHFGTTGEDFSLVAKLH